MNSSPVGKERLTKTAWLICIIAAIGFAFDIYELLMLPLIVRPALLELIGAAPGSPEFQLWVGRLFYLPAVMGGIFGLLGGYLTDRFGRRRILTYSILLYAFAAFASGYSSSPEMLLFFIKYSSHLNESVCRHLLSELHLYRHKELPSDC